MATVYRALEPAPTLNYRSNTWRDEEAAYVERQKASARKANPGDKLAGTLHRVQIADGYATYIVWSSKPLKLVHLETGDGYSASAPYIRGLRLADIKAQAAQDARYAKLFADRVKAVGAKSGTCRECFEPITAAQVPTHARRHGAGTDDLLVEA